MDVSILILFFFVTSSQCQIFTKEQENKITEIVKRTMECHHVPGLAISVVKDSNTWARGFGTADLKTSRSVETSTLFATASLTNAFTMALLAMLLNDTSYTWSTRLSEIKGVNFTFINENLTKQATLADLLAHKTGLWDVVDFGFGAGYPDGTTKECLSRQLEYLPQRDYFPGESFHYLTVMYMLLGHVIEVLGGDTWENLMTSRILNPLGMTSTKVMSSPYDVLNGDVAKPYINPYGEVTDGAHELYRVSPAEPAMGLLSNADDMAKWIQFNLRNGSAPGGEKLLDSKLLAEAFKEHNAISSFKKNLNTPDSTTGYGYAWYTSTYRGFERYWHNGDMFSYLSEIWLFLEQEFGIFISLNGPRELIGPEETTYIIPSLISDIVLGIEPWQNVSTVCSFRLPVRERLYSYTPDLLTTDQMEDYLGTYGNPLLPDIRISIAGNRTGRHGSLKLTWNRIKGYLLSTKSRDEYVFRKTEPWEYIWNMPLPLKFTRNSAKEVEGFDFTMGGSAVMVFRKNLRFIDGCKPFPNSYPAINTAVGVSSPLLMMLTFCTL